MTFEELRAVQAITPAARRELTRSEAFGGPRVVISTSSNPRGVSLLRQNKCLKCDGRTVGVVSPSDQRGLVYHTCTEHISHKFILVDTGD